MIRVLHWCLGLGDDRLDIVSASLRKSRIELSLLGMTERFLICDRYHMRPEISLLRIGR